MIILLFLGFFILLNAHLKLHPYQLYGLIILMRSGNMCRISVSKYSILLPEIYIYSRPENLWRMIVGGGSGGSRVEVSDLECAHA